MEKLPALKAMLIRMLSVSVGLDINVSILTKKVVRKKLNLIGVTVYNGKALNKNIQNKRKQYKNILARKHFT